MPEVLVGDVGGTNSRFGIAQLNGSKIEIEAFDKCENDSVCGFASALEHYLGTTQLDVKGLPAVFALAGPPKNGEVRLTNRDWVIKAEDIRAHFGLSEVHLVNDFIAMARAVPELPEENFLSIIPGSPVASEPILVAGPGTGFGVATLIPMPDGSWHTLGGEGGHMAYAPQTDSEHALLKILQREHTHVSTEHVCAGMGLNAVYKAMCEIFSRSFEPMHPGDMLERASGGDEMFLELCRIRARGTMRAAGNIALLNGTRGGVVLAGGVSERLIDYLREPAAISAFRDREPSNYLAGCPVNLIKDPTAPLVGAGALQLRRV